MNTLYRYVMAFALALPFAAYANDPATPEAAAAAEQMLTEGEVRKVNKDTGKLTIKHGPLENLDMPAMTMVFQVADPVLLDQVKAGDRIRFVADKIDGKFTVMRIEPAQ